MIVTCNECDSSFNVNDSLIKDAGSKVRCSKCSSVFIVYPEASGSESGEDEDILALEMDEGREGLEADEEFGDLAMDGGADDELPDLEDMMDFEEDEPAVDASADEGLGELDFDLDLDTDETDTAAVDVTEDSDEEGLDLDFDLDEEDMDESVEAEQGAIETAGMDLPDLEMELDDFDETEQGDTTGADSDMDLDMEADDEPLAAAAGGGDELDLSDLEDLVDSDAELELEDAALDAAEDDDMDLDMELEDFDETAEGDTAGDEPALDLEMEADEEPAVSAADGADELDLSDLEDLVAADADLELEGTAMETAEGVDLDLDLESGPEAEAVETASDELDLSDLEDIIGSGDEQAGEDVTAGAEEGLDLDLDLNLEEEPVEAAPAAKAPAADFEGADELDFSDLEGIAESDETPPADDLVLDFEVDEGAAGPAAANASQAPEELEISDLEKMLEPDEKPGSAGEDELELDLELEGESAAGVGDSAAAKAGEDDAEFLDIEKMLEESGSAAPADQGAEDLVELDLEAVLQEDETGQSAEPELELNLDLDAESPLDSSASGEDDLEFKLLDSDEETLQFGATQAAATLIEDSPAASSDLDATTEDFASDEFTDTRDFVDQTDARDSLGVAMGAPIKKRKTGKPVMVAVLILLLCILGIVVTNNLGIKIPYVSDIQIPYISDIKIPYLSGLLKSEPQDLVGNLKISPLAPTITYKFVENASAGKIFVISGQVRNEYDHPRSNIKITGRLYRPGKALVNSSTVYCGNMLSDADLERMDFKAISKRLQNRFGDNRSNVQVKAGKTIPFIIVFSKLPANLDEYTVEVAGSSS